MSAEPDEASEAQHQPKGGGGLLRIAVDRPVTVIVSAILVILFGALSVASLPIQLTPDISIPRLTIRTTWPGASPSEIETEILEPQEDAVKDVPGLVRLTSETTPDQGSLTLEFEVDTEIDQALVRTSNRLTQVGNYPVGVRDPRIDTADDSGPPLAVLAVRSLTGDPVAPHRTWFEEVILPEIQRVHGVGDARLIGGQDRVVEIDFDAAELASRGLSIPRLAERVRSELRDVSGGDLTLGRRRLLLRTMAVGTEPSELEDIVVGVGDDGTPLRIGDIGRARLGLRQPAGVAFSDDRPSLIVLLSREAGSNVLEVTRDVRARVESLDDDTFRPEGLSFDVLSDQVEYIEGALSLVQQNLGIGAILAILALFLFLRSFGASAIISVAIPISVFGTVLGMSAFGRTVNVVSLAGITFAIGMVLDNSIVSLESIDTWRRRIPDPKEAAMAGIGEVWGALIASTATTAAVFIPVILWDGEVGQLLRDVAVAISFAVITSLGVSVWVIPSLAAKLPPPKPASESRLGDVSKRARREVGRAVRWLSRSPLRSAATVVIAVGVSLTIAWALLPPLEYLPRGNRNLIFGILTPPPGTSVEELDRTGRIVQGQVAARAGRDGIPGVERSFFVGNPARLFAGAVAEDPDRVRDLLAFLRVSQNAIPGTTAFTTQASLFGRAAGGRSIELDLTGGDLGVLTATGGQMMGLVREAVPGAQVRPIPSLDPGAPELRLYPRRGPTAALGPSTAELGLIVDALVDGSILGELGPPGEPQLDVVIRALRRSGGPIEDPEALASAPVALATGEVVPLGVLVDLREELGPTTIRRIERRRAITLQISPPDEIPLETALERIESEVLQPMRADGSLPAEVGVAVSGTAGDLELAKGRFAEVLLLALIISYLLMSALFEDFLAPIVVLVTLPLAAAGGVGALRLVDAFLSPQALDLMTALGFLILIGVVVNNAILVVDGALARLREGVGVEEAAGAAVEARVRPILMTTLTSLAGLLPMVLIPGSGSELYRGVGAIVLGGLLVATALTLFVVPSFFSLVYRIRLRFSA